MPSIFAEPTSNEFTVKIMPGSSVPNCEETRSCLDPVVSSIDLGEIITWINKDTAVHVIQSGVPNMPNELFNSGLISTGDTFYHKFDEAGTYPYYCMIHPWKLGQIMVGIDTFSSNIDIKDWIRVS